MNKNGTKECYRIERFINFTVQRIYTYFMVGFCCNEVRNFARS